MGHLCRNISLDVFRMSQVVSVIWIDLMKMMSQVPIKKFSEVVWDRIFESFSF
jgi:hypothetical protein